MNGSLVLERVRAGYGPVEVLHGMDLVFPAGSVVALVGHNGAGKTTVLRCAAGLVRPRRGRILWGGVDVTRRSPYQRAQSGLTLVPDEHGAFTSLTVAENLSLFGRPRPTEESAGVAVEAFPELEPLLEHRAATLSGGERQMLALSRVLVRPGEVLLLDEVSRGLSSGVTARFYERLRALAHAGRVVVLCEQFLETALAVADLVYVIRRGTVAFAGEPSELDPAHGLYATLGSS